MVRIDVSAVVLQVQGELHTTELTLLEGEVKRWVAQGAAVTLDVSGVRAINWVGLEQVQSWVEHYPRLRLRCQARELRGRLEAQGTVLDEGGPAPESRP